MPSSAAGRRILPAPKAGPSGRGPASVEVSLLKQVTATATAGADRSAGLGA
jgi:hypothetical protein